MTVEALAPPVTVSSVAGGPDGAPPVSSAARVLRWLPKLAILLVVLALHFRPWQAGLLEEWGIASSWKQQGWAAYTSRLPLFAGRPLHLLPHYVSLAVWDKGFAGEFAVLSVVAIGQVVVSVWALAPLIRSGAVRWALGAVLGMHPWWLAGDILRFLPAQVSVLLFVVSLGAAIRYAESARRVHLCLVAAALVAGLLTYQLLVLTAVVVATAVGVVARRRTRTVLELVGVNLAIAVADTWYTLWLTPRIWPQSYENGIRGQALHPIQDLRSLAHTVIDTPSLLGFLLAAAAIAGSLVHVDRRSAAVLLTLVAVSPLTALALAGSPPQLHDPDRVALPVGVTAWVAVALAAWSWFRLGTRRWTVWVPVGTVALLSLAAAGVGYAHWTDLAAKQRLLLDAVEHARASAPAGVSLIVADHTGTYGDVYTLIPPYLSIAVDLEAPAGPPATLCTAAGVERRQPDAARFPIATTPDCSAVPGFDSAVELSSVQVAGGQIVIYAARS